MRSSNGSWLYERGAQLPKERFWVIWLDKNGSINLLDVELQRLEIGTSYNRLLVYRVSPDSKGLRGNKRILYYILALTGNKCKSMTLGVVLYVLYQGIFTMILTAAFRIILRPCKSSSHYLIVHLARYCKNLFVWELSHARVLA